MPDVDLLPALPAEIQSVLAYARVGALGAHAATVSVSAESPSAVHVRLRFDLDQEVQQDDWRVVFGPAFTPTMRWAPHLTPSADHVVDQHVFRAPALVVCDETTYLAIVPELELVPEALDVARDARSYLDQSALENELTLGLSRTRVPEHVLFERQPGAVHQGTVEIGFWIFVSRDPADLDDPWRRVSSFLWTRYARPLLARGQPSVGDLAPFVRHAYAWAFERWPAVWQEFELEGRPVGAPVFIVNVTQSPNYPGPVNEREFRSIWNQCWFSSLHSACGLFRFARREGDGELLRRARLTKELALSFPQKGGLFHAVIGTEMEQVEEAGQQVMRSRGWQTAYFGNSNRNPLTWDARRSPWHLPDMSHTALHMLQWFSELEADPRLLRYCRDYAERLLVLQTPDGHVPSWLDLESEVPLETMQRSPQTALSALFLLTLAEITQEQRYLTAGLSAIGALRELVLAGQWEDFETYFSCSRWGAESQVGKRVARNGTFKQNTLCMAWCAEAYAKAFELLGDRSLLALGQRCLDELSMYQAVWQPPYIYVPAFGGFGVMNCDGEWNDARQSVFAELFVRYGKLLDEPEYTERGIAALRASFSMMFCPENPRAYEQWQLAWPFFGAADHGFMMENYGHGGRTSPQGEGIGEFTIYDWGSGSAAEGYQRMRDRYPDLSL